MEVQAGIFGEFNPLLCFLADFCCSISTLASWPLAKINYSIPSFLASVTSPNISKTTDVARDKIDNSWSVSELHSREDFLHHPYEHCDNMQLELMLTLT